MEVFCKKNRCTKFTGGGEGADLDFARHFRGGRLLADQQSNPEIGCNLVVIFYLFLIL